MSSPKWKPVVPIPQVSNPAFFSGADRELIINSSYGEQRTLKEVVPTQSSNFRNFMTDKNWQGVADFLKRREFANINMNNLHMKKKKNHTPVGIPGRPSIRVNLIDTAQYPRSDKYYYTTHLRRLNMDDERLKDIYRGKAIPIKEPQGPKKDIKSPYSIYSVDFGPTLDDANPYGNRYTCRCGKTQMQQNEGMTCSNCGGVVEFRGDDFKKTGWIVLNGDYVIHQGLYKSIEFFIGKKSLENILKVVDEKDENGFSVVTEKSKNEPFADIGMMGFYEHFDEIMDYYRKVNPAKEDYYQDIMGEREKVFTHSIPVYTTLLRPYRMKGDVFTFEDTNPQFNIMARLGAILNDKKSVKGNRMRKSRNQLLYDLQTSLNEVYDEVIKIMSSKKGVIRNLYGGRCNFTSRAVIVQNWRLKTDQVTLPYHALCELLQQSIINILNQTYGMPMHVARSIWENAQRDYDERVFCIIKYIINAYPEGIPLLINRNPTINYGSILQMFCVGMSGDSPDNYTMNIPLLILPALNADFDGDTLNIIYLINDAIKKAANTVFNPRNAMHISRNDGMMNPQFNHQRDTVVLLNTLLSITRDNYTQEDENEINACKNYVDAEISVA